MKGKPHLSIVIPVYNEALRIESGLVQTIAYFAKQKYAWELIIVDDGSDDKTHLLAKRLLIKSPHQLLRHKFNMGKGQAIRTGVGLAKGKLILFYDIDLSTPLTEIPKMLSQLKSYPVVIGVRRHRKAQVLAHQPILRESLGHIFTKLTNWLLIPGIVDATCGFKGYQQPAAKLLFTRSKIKRWAFDAEILFLARKFGFPIAQLPVAWRHDPGTKVHLAHDGWQALVDLVRVRIYDFFGKYN